nr:MAG TPA: hypothetical protein [Caudoviricetes sp.]
MPTTQGQRGVDSVVIISNVIKNSLKRAREGFKS